MALIVIEGVDRTGKSTLADKMPQTLSRLNGRGTRVIHAERPESPRAVDEYLEPILKYVPNASRNVVLDRSFVGESVWPTLFSRTPALTPGEYALLVAAYASKGALFVMCERPLDEIHAEFVEARPPEPLPTALVPAADAMFRQQFRFLEQQAARTMEFDMGTVHADDVATAAINEEKNCSATPEYCVVADDLEDPAFAGLLR